MQDELIRAAKRGSAAAYHELFDLWYPKAYRISKSICDNKDMAEDALQESLVRFWHALPRLHPPETVEGYFMRIVANEAKRLQRKKRAKQEELLDNTYSSGADDIEADITAREQAADLMKKVELLPEKLKAAIKLHYYGGFTEVKTAEILNISESSVKMRLFRGRDRLKQMLANSELERGI